jgi:hypothetical protein
MLGFDDINSEGSNVVIINGGEAGIVENVNLNDIEIGESSSGSAFIKFTFQEEAGGKVYYFEYDINPSDETAESKTASQLKRLKHVVTKFLPEGTNLPKANTFPEMYAALKALLEANNYKNRALRIKLVYNAKNFPAFPKYVPFLENMEIPKDESRLKLKSLEEGGIDKLTKSRDDDPSALVAPSSGGLFGGAAAEENSADRPF